MQSKEMVPAREPWEDWDECSGECESCCFTDCREYSELEELKFSKLMKEMAISRMLRRISEIEKRIKELES